jgi:hypothetical protein
MAGVQKGEREVDISALTHDPERYGNTFVHAHACVNVTFHEVTLVACGSENPQINIEPGEGRDAEEAYSRLIGFSHQHMGQEPPELPVVVQGVYRGERMGNEYRHTLQVVGFKAVGD